MATLLVGATAASVLAGCGSSPSSSTSTAVGCSTQGAVATATTKSYRYVLDVGPVGQMYAPGQAPAGARGETMFGGTMSMASGPDAQHLEVHICSVGTDRVVTGAHPTITLRDTTAGTTVAVPVATMQGLGEGQKDFHYGNNVLAPPGHAFTVTVTANGQSAPMAFTRSSGS
ncbi:MAG TPA: hypothetical protein VG184_02495 [Acidimicrobiales bacterium]|nr:hypothetical protein [Acidimicrobiales bacterium]